MILLLQTSKAGRGLCFNSVHFPLPFLHLFGASCVCSGSLLHWCVWKNLAAYHIMLGLCPGTSPSRGFGSISKAANSKTSSHGHCCCHQMASVCSDLGKKAINVLLPFVKHVHLLARQWGTLGFVHEQCSGLTLCRVIANGTEMTFGAFKDTWPRSLLTSCACWCCGLGGGRNGGAIFPCSAVSPMCHLTPFCTHCDAVEHENKNTLPQVYQVSRHSEWVGPTKNKT